MPDIYSPHSAQGLQSLQWVEGLFSVERLPGPPIPEELVHSLRAISDLAVGTRELPEGASLYDLEICEAAAPDWGDAAFAGFGGRGFTCWAAHYYVSYGPVLMLLQFHWASPYIDAEEAAKKIAEHFFYAETLIKASRKAMAAGAWRAERRLRIVQSDFTDSRWGWSEGGETDWKRSATALFDAMTELNQRVREDTELK